MSCDSGPPGKPAGRCHHSRAWEPMLPGTWRAEEQRCGYTALPRTESRCLRAHVITLFIKGSCSCCQKHPPAPRRSGAPGAACESPSVEDPEPDSARRRFPPGSMGKGLAVTPGPRGCCGGGTSMCALSCETTSVWNELFFQTELSPAQLDTSCLPAGGPCTRFPIGTDL